MTGRKRSAGVTLLLFVLVVFTSLALLNRMAQDRYHQERVIYAMADPSGDDYGPGTYKYPTDAIFDPKGEHFDLIRFTFFTQRNNYYFDMTFPRVTNPWGAPEGFSHPTVQVYISSDDTKAGRTKPFKTGSNVLFDPQNPWSYLIKVVSFNKTAVYWSTDKEGFEGRVNGVTTELRPDQKTIRVTVPRSLLPGEPYRWKYYVLVGSLDGAGPDNFRVVKTAVGQYNFGGGTDTEYSPNVIDLLAPAGAQERMLRAYSVTDRDQAVIEPVGPSPAPSKPEIFLDKAIETLQKMRIML